MDLDRRILKHIRLLFVGCAWADFRWVVRQLGESLPSARPQSCSQSPPPICGGNQFCAFFRQSEAACWHRSMLGIRIGTSELAVTRRSDVRFRTSCAIYSPSQHQTKTNTSTVQPVFLISRCKSAINRRVASIPPERGQGRPTKCLPIASNRASRSVASRPPSAPASA